jgi:hypothetical protein
MSKKPTSPTTLARPKATCPQSEFRLNKLPVIHGNIEQLSSQWHNKFKYFQDDSHGYNM